MDEQTYVEPAKTVVDRLVAQDKKKYYAVLPNTREAARFRKMVVRELNSRGLRFTVNHRNGELWIPPVQKGGLPVFVSIAMGDTHNVFKSLKRDYEVLYELTDA